MLSPAILPSLSVMLPGLKRKASEANALGDDRRLVFCWAVQSILKLWNYARSLTYTCLYAFSICTQYVIAVCRGEHFRGEIPCERSSKRPGGRGMWVIERMIQWLIEQTIKREDVRVIEPEIDRTVERANDQANERTMKRSSNYKGPIDRSIEQHSDRATSDGLDGRGPCPAAWSIHSVIVIEFAVFFELGFDIAHVIHQRLVNALLVLHLLTIVHCEHYSAINHTLYRGDPYTPYLDSNGFWIKIRGQGSTLAPLLWFKILNPTKGAWGRSLPPYLDAKRLNHVRGLRYALDSFNPMYWIGCRLC